MRGTLVMLGILSLLALSGCGGGGDGSTSADLDSPEASVREASKDFINAAINREGDRVCDLSSQAALANFSTLFPAVAVDCDKGMDELFAKLPESAIEKDEEFLESLSEAEVEVEGDKAYVTGVGTNLEFVLADGHWLLNDSEEKSPEQERQEKEVEEREEEVGGEELAAELEPELMERKPGRDLYYVRCGRQRPEEGQTFICEAETLDGEEIQRGRLEAEFVAEGTARIASLSLRDHR
jgi:hypothetical protein